MAEGHWINVQQSYTSRPPQNHQDLTNRIHYWDAVYINNTPIEVGFNHDWEEYTGPTPPHPPIIVDYNKFPWVLYARKLRQKRR